MSKKVGVVLDKSEAGPGTEPPRATVAVPEVAGERRPSPPDGAPDPVRADLAEDQEQCDVHRIAREQHRHDAREQHARGHVVVDRQHVLAQALVESDVRATGGWRRLHPVRTATSTSIVTHVFRFIASFPRRVILRFPRPPRRDPRPCCGKRRLTSVADPRPVYPYRIGSVARLSSGQAPDPAGRFTPTIYRSTPWNSRRKKSAGAVRYSFHCTRYFSP